MTCCLLASSVTIHLAARRGTAISTFVLWWGSTIVLGILFLLGTAREWSDLIVRHHLTISRNLFGTAYYTLVGFHALHVTLGVVAMLVVGGLIVLRKIVTPARTGRGIGFVVLAFCRRGLDRGFHGCVFRCAVARSKRTCAGFDSPMSGPQNPTPDNEGFGTPPVRRSTSTCPVRPPLRSCWRAG